MANSLPRPQPILRNEDFKLLGAVPERRFQATNVWRPSHEHARPRGKVMVMPKMVTRHLQMASRSRERESEPGVWRSLPQIDVDHHYGVVDQPSRIRIIKAVRRLLLTQPGRILRQIGYVDQALLPVQLQLSLRSTPGHLRTPGSPLINPDRSHDRGDRADSLQPSGRGRMLDKSANIPVRPENHEKADEEQQDAGRQGLGYSLGHTRQAATAEFV